MTVLVGYASTHWSTKGIAEEIGSRLMKAGVKASVRALSDVDNLAHYDAAVLGSAVHNQAWLPSGADFLDRQEDALGRMPVWLFSVSSVGSTSSFFGPLLTRLIRRTRKDTHAVARARELPRFRGHRDFAGAIERGQWGRAGDLFLRVCGGWPGDYRDWHDVDEWANGIASQMQAAEWAKERTRLRLVPPLPASGRVR
jgi:menaquinone-dependent protoporphyrinogen oxidase